MKTTNYDQFKFIKSNRKIGNVERLKESIMKIGYNESKPILINENFEILDGQNRFMACKELGLPILYIINKRNGVTDDEIITELNKNQTIWRLNDYIHHFAQLGVPWYVEVRDFIDRYKFGPSNSITLCATVKLGSRKFHPVKTGMDKPLNPNRHKEAEFILSCAGLPFALNGKFVMAVHALFKSARPDQIQKLRKRYMTIPEQPKVVDYLRVFANIINRGIHDEDKKISL